MKTEAEIVGAMCRAWRNADCNESEAMRAALRIAIPWARERALREAAEVAVVWWREDIAKRILAIIPARPLQETTGG